MKKVLVLLYQIFIFAPIFILATIVTTLSVIVGCWLGDRKFWSCYPPIYWSKLTCRLALCSVKVRRLGDLEKNSSYVIVANHQSAFDIFLIYGYLGGSIKWVQKKELRSLPFVGKASEMAGHVFVDQSSLKSMKETIDKAKNELDKGASIAMFPEGQRTYTGKIGRFKRGAFIIAKEMNLPIVPVTINGPFDVMKIHTYLIMPHKLELVIHEPIYTKNIEDDEIPQLMERCKEIIANELWDKYK